MNDNPDKTDIFHLETLIKLSFLRTKERFLTYFLTLVVSFCTGIALVLCYIFFGGIIFLLFSLTKSVVLLTALSAIAIIATLLLTIWIFGWITLTTNQIIISNDKIGVMDAFKMTKRYVWRYQWYLLLFFLFTLLLLPLGIISFFIIFLLWSYWSVFATFVFLERKERGLKNLWISRYLVNQKFWGIAGRLLLLNVASWLISFLLSSTKNNFAGFGSVLIQLFAQPFIISATFLMYQNLSKPTAKVKAAYGWIVVSVISWILLIGLSYLALPNLVKNLQNTFDNNAFKQIIPTPRIPLNDI